MIFEKKINYTYIFNYALTTVSNVLKFFIVLYSRFYFVES